MNPMFPGGNQNSPSYRLPANTDAPLTLQQTAPDFLFGSQSKRRALISPLVSGASVQLSSSSTSVFTSPLSTRNRPPLRTMREELLCPLEPSRDSVTSPRSRSSISDSQSVQELAAHWVTVFGFSREDATDVLKLFARHGTIVAHQFPAEGNWVYLRYASPIQAQQALSRNGQILNGRLRLGVVPVDQQELMDLEDDTFLNLQAGDENNAFFAYNRSVMSEDFGQFGVSPSASGSTIANPLETSYNSSLISQSGRPGVRSLRASFNAADNYYRVDKEIQPEKSYGILDKLWKFVS